MAAATPAVIVCPGGSYRALASNHEGRQVASYLNSLGVAAFVLRYRLGPRYHHPIELGDAQRAIRTLRSRAGDWRLDPARIGIMGFSAGGHLAMSASTLFDPGDARAADPIDRVASRPDFAVLGYPVISMTAPWTHAGSKTNLLGDNPDPRWRSSLSGELAVTKDTPQTFIFQTNEDTVVPAENAFTTSWRCGGRVCRRRCTCSKRVRTGSDWPTTIRPCLPGRRCSLRGFADAV